MISVCLGSTLALLDGGDLELDVVVERLEVVAGDLAGHVARAAGGAVVDRPPSPGRRGRRPGRQEGEAQLEAAARRIGREIV